MYTCIHYLVEQEKQSLGTFFQEKDSFGKEILAFKRSLKQAYTLKLNPCINVRGKISKRKLIFLYTKSNFSKWGFLLKDTSVQISRND
jgi:hypothetical protein